MNKILFSVFMLAAIASSAQVVLLNENFDNGFPAAWQSVDDDGLIPYASVSYLGNSFGITEDFDSTNVGDSIAAATSWFDPVGTASNYLITPQITLTVNGNQLFYEVKSQDPSYPDGYQVLISNTIPDIDSLELWDTLFLTDAELPVWTERVLDLDSFVNQSVYIAFHHASPDKFILCLDNIRVLSDTTLSVNDLENNISVNVYPNPVSDELIFTSSEEMNNVKLEILDLSGRICGIYSANGMQTRIPVAEMANGMYLLRAIYPGHRVVNRSFSKQ